MSDRDLGSVDRYNRYAEDWRFHHKLIWETPSIASAIFIGLLTISYVYLDLLVRAIALGVGAALILGLTLSVRKHRFGADLRTNFLYNIVKDDKERFPIRSPEGLEYLKKNELLDEEVNHSKKIGELEKKRYSHPADKAMELQKLEESHEKKKKPKRKAERLIKKSSEVYLIWFMFFTAMLLSALCIFEVIQTIARISFLTGEEVPSLQILKNITSVNNPQTKEIVVTVKSP
jgi:hypothetical protein